MGYPLQSQLERTGKQVKLLRSCSDRERNAWDVVLGLCFTSLPLSVGWEFRLGLEFQTERTGRLRG